MVTPNTLKYAVIHFYSDSNVTDLKCHVIYDNYHDRKAAERQRTQYLKEFSKAEPQNIQVIQYKV